MSDTITMECECCRIETDCIDNLCEWCSGYNYQLKERIADLELLEKAVADVKGHYPEKIFPSTSDSVDAESGTFARLICDNIISTWKELKELKGE